MVPPRDGRAAKGEVLTAHGLSSLEQMAVRTANRVRDLHAELGVAYRDIAVLCRTNANLKQVREQLDLRKIPCAGAAQTQLVRLERGADASALTAAQLRTLEWRKALNAGAGIIAMVRLLVCLTDALVLSKASKLFARQMHALTKLHITEHGQTNRRSLVDAVRYMVDHAPTFFRGEAEERSLLRPSASQEGDAQGSEHGRQGAARDTFNLGRDQLAACRDLLSAHDRLYATAMNDGRRVSLRKLVLTAQTVVQERARGKSRVEDGGEALRSVAHAVDLEIGKREGLGIYGGLGGGTANAAADEQPDGASTAGADAGAKNSNNNNNDDEDLFGDLARSTSSQSTRRQWAGVSSSSSAAAASSQRAGGRSDASARSESEWSDALVLMLQMINDVEEDDELDFSTTSSHEKVDAVAVSSIHRAKGKEWPVVLIPFCMHGTIPIMREADGEERRVFYVAMTRAMRTCEFLYPARDDGGFMSGGPSVYLKELAPRTIRHVNDSGAETDGNGEEDSGIDDDEDDHDDEDDDDFALATSAPSSSRFAGNRGGRKAGTKRSAAATTTSSSRASADTRRGRGRKRGRGSGGGRGRGGSSGGRRRRAASFQP